MTMLAGWKAVRCLGARTSYLGGVRAYSPSALLLEKALPPRRKITEDEIEEYFLKGSGPGGQKINKTSSAVQLKHLPTGIVVKSQETRSRQQNRKLARQILSEKLDEMEKGSESRTAIKTERARAKKASANKKSNRKYRKLAESKEGEAGQAAEEANREGHDVESVVKDDGKTGDHATVKAAGPNGTT